jgi:hypothetical protein
VRRVAVFAVRWRVHLWSLERHGEQVASSQHKQFAVVSGAGGETFLCIEGAVGHSSCETYQGSRTKTQSHQGEQEHGRMIACGIHVAQQKSAKPQALKIEGSYT